MGARGLSRYATAATEHATELQQGCNTLSEAENALRECKASYEVLLL